MPEHESPPPAIEVRGLSKKFGSVVALNAVSFAIRPGELFFLLGPSGCGKTTLLRVLAGLENPDQGEVCFDGRDVLEFPPHLRGAPMVFQNYALWPHMSVAENVGFGLVERGIAGEELRERVSEALVQVDLKGLEQRRPGELSGGQQQRVVLARALVLKPGIVLLDEPLSNLDAKLRVEMREEIERLHRTTDITFVYVTHDQTEALSLADRMVVMEGGEIRALGDPGFLYHNPPNHFTANFLGEANWVPVTVKSIGARRTELQTPFGLWQAAPSPGNEAPSMTVGDELVCLVRPENLVLALPGSTDGMNHLQAEVRSVRMNGSTVTADLVAGDIPLKAEMLSRRSPALTAGTTCTWGVRPEATILIP